MLAGGPAANTRRTGPGISTIRPAPSLSVRRWAAARRGAASVASAAPTNRRRVSTGSWTSVLGDDDVGRLDDRVGGVTLAQGHLVDGLDRDGRGDHRAANVDLDVRGRLATHHLHHATLQDVAGAELHVFASFAVGTPGIAMTAPGSSAMRSDRQSV